MSRCRHGGAPSGCKLCQTPAAPPDKAGVEALRSKVAELVMRRPDKAATILASWLGKPLEKSARPSAPSRRKKAA